MSQYKTSLFNGNRTLQDPERFNFYSAMTAATTSLQFRLEVCDADGERIKAKSTLAISFLKSTNIANYDAFITSAATLKSWAALLMDAPTHTSKATDLAGSYEKIGSAEITVNATAVTGETYSYNLDSETSAVGTEGRRLTTTAAYTNGSAEATTFLFETSDEGLLDINITDDGPRNIEVYFPSTGKRIPMTLPYYAS